MATHKVLYDFAGEEKKMLKVKAGELVTVTQTSGNSWCTVQKGSTSGLVPATYLEAILPEVSSLMYYICVLLILIGIRAHDYNC